MADGRANDVANIVFSFLHGAGPFDEELAAMFMLGYYMRGFDSILDFGLDADEFKDSILHTLAVTTIGSFVSLDELVEAITKGMSHE